MMNIYYDAIQEGVWFQQLHEGLLNAELLPFPNRGNGPQGLQQVLAYDMPDIVLVDDGNPILVLERTREVPSGHNVGQRFARLVAAAQMRVPVVYFGPYAAYKHGGATQGPRYMNLRLFYALGQMARIERTAVTTINWPVDENYELVQTPRKDKRVREYLNLFFDLYGTLAFGMLPDQIRNSQFERQQEAERKTFISSEVARPEEYGSPPDSVTIAPWRQLSQLAREHPQNLSHGETVLYQVGMRYIRSDPYTGMAMLYSYLYCSGLRQRTRNLVLHFPHITKQAWSSLAGSDRKDIRLYRLSADGILFRDGYLPHDAL